MDWFGQQPNAIWLVSHEAKCSADSPLGKKMPYGAVITRAFGSQTLGLGCMHGNAAYSQPQGLRPFKKLVVFLASEIFKSGLGHPLHFSIITVFPRRIFYLLHLAQL